MSYKTNLKEFTDLDDLLDVAEELLEACEDVLKLWEGTGQTPLKTKLQQAVSKAKGE